MASGSALWGGIIAARWAEQTVERLAEHRAGINAINVFPVADGDTGSNLYHTVSSAYRAVAQLPAGATLSDVMAAMTAGALRGARGNSGLILSVALQGVSDALTGLSVLNAERFAEALELAAHRVRSAVADPVEGTMITVLTAMAEQARKCAEAGDDLVKQIHAVRARSYEALRETTGQLDTLTQAQVVDAGSAGLAELMDLLYITVSHAAYPETVPPISNSDDTYAHEFYPTPHPSYEGVAPLPYEGDAVEHEGDAVELVFFLSEGKRRSRAITQILKKAGGDSIVVSGSRAHVHIGSYHKALAILERMEKYQIQDLRVERLPGNQIANNSVAHSHIPGHVAIIALVSGVEFMLHCGILGAHCVNTAVPNWHEHLDELCYSSSTPVIVAPSSYEYWRTIRSLESRPEVTVVPTTNPAHLISALAVSDNAEEPALVVEDMTDVVDTMRSGALWPVVCHRAGPILGAQTDVLITVQHSLRAVKPHMLAAACALFDELLPAETAEQRSMISVVCGRELSTEKRDAIKTLIAQRYPEIHTEFFTSGDPAYYLAVGVE